MSPFLPAKAQKRLSECYLNTEKSAEVQISLLYHGKEKGKNLTFKARKGRGKRSEVGKKCWGRWERLWRAEEKWEAGEVAGSET